MKIWVTSDNHYGHRNIPKYSGRTQFMSDKEKEIYSEILKIKVDSDREKAINEFKLSSDTINKMDRTMIDNHNSLVKPEDFVINGGDFSLGNRSYRKDIRKQLNGTIILIKGSHDDKLSILGMDGFIAVGEPIVIDNMIFTHEPMKDIPAGRVNIHGHIHEKQTTGRRICICVEHTGYYPLALDSIRQIIRGKGW